jgi:pantoate kinase
MKEASAFAPGHLTGFFQICDKAKNPLEKGSRGAGFSIDLGVYTKVQSEPSKWNQIDIIINGKSTREAVVSENVTKRILKKMDTPQKVKINHEIQTPIGAGFGSSGGGAITTALALNEAFELGMSYIETSKIAHLAEIECKTGLGTVFATTQGGFGVLFEAGAPGIGKAIKYDASNELTAFCVYFGPISTSEALTNLGLRKRINDLGGKFVDEFKENLYPTNFMELSRKFTDYIGISTPKLRTILKASDRAGIPCSMAMFGEALFSLVEKHQAESVANFYSKIIQGQRFFGLNIDQAGARLISI